MDFLADILQTLKLRGNLYFRTDLSEPWGIYVPADSNIARFHVVISGECWLGVGDEDEPFKLTEGDLAIVPHGLSHRLMNSPDSNCRHLLEVLSEQKYTGDGYLCYGGGGKTTSLVCGYFSFDSDVMHPLIESLPRQIIVKGTSSLNFIWIDTVMKIIGNEAESNQIGSKAIIERLSEILFIQVIRAYSTTTGESIGYLAALGDSQISRALTQIHKAPGRKWTLEQLAREAGLSRSSLAEKFPSVMGVPPMEYLNRWRMLIARNALKETRKSITEIAEDVGYESEASFSTAFKRQFGESPSAFRGATN